MRGALTPRVRLGPGPSCLRLPPGTARGHVTGAPSILHWHHSPLAPRLPGTQPARRVGSSVEWRWQYLSQARALGPRFEPEVPRGWKEGAFFKVGPKKNQVTCFKSEHSGSKGVPGSGSQSICTEGRGQGCPGDSHRTTSGRAWALRARGSAPDILHAPVREQTPLLQINSWGPSWQLLWGGHPGPLRTSPPGGQHRPHPRVSRAGSKETEWPEQPGLAPV